MESEPGSGSVFYVTIPERKTELARDEQFRHLPVVILTTSAEEKEILKMYQLRCSSYIVKPVDFEQFHRAIRTIAEYWFEVVVLPNGRR